MCSCTMVAPTAVTYGEEAGKFGKYPLPLQVCEVPSPPPLLVQKFLLFELAPHRDTRWKTNYPTVATLTYPNYLLESMEQPQVALEEEEARI